MTAARVVVAAGGAPGRVRRGLFGGVLLGLLVWVVLIGVCAPGAWASEKVFGVESFTNTLTLQGGGEASVAGSHPYALTSTLTFNHKVLEEEYFPELKESLPTRVKVYGEPKNVEVNLPRGLVADPLATPVRCSEAELEVSGCPNESAVGTLVALVAGYPYRGAAAVYNMVAPTGVAGQFAANVAGLGIVVHIDGKVRTGGDYGITADVSSIQRQFPIYSVITTIWGDPSDPSHDEQRGPCYENDRACPVPATETALLTMPTACPLTPGVATVNVESWQHVNVTAFPQANPPSALSGCSGLRFEPAFEALPETPAADSPTGLEVGLRMPQDERLADSADGSLDDAVVTLPAGMTLNPSTAGGREGCPLLTGTEPEKEQAEAKKELVGIDMSSAQDANCPNSSKLGTAEVTTPLLDHPLPGTVYLAAQEANPFGSLFAIYLVVDDPVSGVVVKLAGHVEVGGEGAEGLAPGQIRTTFLENPELPVEAVKLTLWGGPRGPLATPPACGGYTTTAALTPWSSDRPGTEPFTGESLELAEPSSRFAISQGCAPGFAPSFMAGTSNVQAGGFTPFDVTISREDEEQQLAGVSVTAPPGLLGVLKSVARCPEPQASKGECGPESLIGETSAAVGVGPDPYWVTAGKVYLTGPYNNGPFGLSIVIPTKAGPFTLTGNGGYGREIVRASIRVNPSTGQITTVSDPLPTIIDGVPTDIRTIEVTINRPGFVFNPTNCSQLEATGQITSTQGATANLGTRFEVANCANLPYTPTFTASTQAKASKADGASLTIKITAPPGQANTAKAVLTFPKQLPSRLTTLQQACLAAVFTADPASCPAGSVIGTAKVTTPLLTSQLTGPIYLVSHGGEEFPDAEIVLQGEGITLILDGHTHIKHGITTSSFNSVPDAPFTSFETTLPEGPHSIFATNIPVSANYDLCGQKLTIPVTFTSQNGATDEQAPKIAVAPCPKPHKTKKKKHNTKKAARNTTVKHAR
jgi:hypothetical protein